MRTPINRGDPGTGAIATTTGGTTAPAEYARNATGGTDVTGAIVRAADGTNGTAEYARNATGGTNGPTQAGTRQGRTNGTAEYARNATGGTNGPTPDGNRQGTTRVQSSSVHAEEAITPEPSTDLEVNGPRWDNHFVDMVPESDDGTNIDRDSCTRSAEELSTGGAILRIRI